MNRKPIKKSDFDKSVRPQDDFYRHVNGGWFRKNPIPDTLPVWGAFHKLRERSTKQLHEILKDISRKKHLAKGSDEEKLYDIYKASMAMSKRTKEGLAKLEPMFTEISKLESKEDFPKLFAHLHMTGVDAPWAIAAEQDFKKSERMVPAFYQAGIGVPDRNYLVKKDKESRRIKNAYKKYMQKMLQAEKYWPRTKIPGVISKIIRIETVLAEASMTPEEWRDLEKLYNKFTATTLKKKYRNFDWKEYFDLIALPRIARNHIMVCQPKFFALINKMLKTLSISDWKMYLRWHALDSYASSLGEPFITIRFNYAGKELTGTPKMPELWKRSVGVVNGIMGEGIGKIYIKRYFPSKAKKRIEQLVKNLVKVYRVRIKNLDWLSTATKKKALEKLNKVTPLLGHPTKWESYKQLKVSRESHVQNIINASIFGFKKDMKKLAKPTNYKEWHMTPPTVNAYYSPTSNQIVFPAGILQPPFFYFDADDAVNYGAIGEVIGHELTHGFDDNGSTFDGKGNMKDWWKPNDKRNFERKTKVLENQFSKYKVVDGVGVSGKLTLGENIADLGGLLIAYDALKLSQRGKKKRKIDGLTPEQRFFVSYAISAQSIMRNEVLKLRTLTDPHAPSEFRVNGPASNLQEFYEAFNVQKGDRLYRTPEERAQIW